MEFEMIDTQNSSSAYVVIYNLIMRCFFGLEQEDGRFNYSHVAGTSPPSHKKAEK